MAPIKRLTPAVRPEVEIVETSLGTPPPPVRMTRDVEGVLDNGNSDLAVEYMDGYKTDYGGALTVGLHLSRARRELRAIRLLDAQRSPVKGSFVNDVIDNIESALDYDMQAIVEAGVAQIRATAATSTNVVRERSSGFFRRR